MVEIGAHNIFLSMTICCYKEFRPSATPPPPSKKKKKKKERKQPQPKRERERERMLPCSFPKDLIISQLSYFMLLAEHHKDVTGNNNSQNSNLSANKFKTLHQYRESYLTAP